MFVNHIQLGVYGKQFNRKGKCNEISETHLQLSMKGALITLIARREQNISMNAFNKL